MKQVTETYMLLPTILPFFTVEELCFLLSPALVFWDPFPRVTRGTWHHQSSPFSYIYIHVWDFLSSLTLNKINAKGFPMVSGIFHLENSHWTYHLHYSSCCTNWTASNHSRYLPHIQSNPESCQLHFLLFFRILMLFPKFMLFHCNPGTSVCTTRLVSAWSSPIDSGSPQAVPLTAATVVPSQGFPGNLHSKAASLILHHHRNFASAPFSVSKVFLSISLSRFFF